MVGSLELRRIVAFASLPDDQINWFLSYAQEVFVQAGEAFVRQGDPAEAGDVSGVFPFSRMKRFTVTGRALSDGRLLKFPASHFPELIQKMPELTATLVAMMSDRIREGTRIEQQRDRLVSLGKLSAGLAHELNNPASAAKRASDQMRKTLEKLRSANSELWRQPLDHSDKARIEEVEASLLQSEMTQLDGIGLADLEEHLGSILRSRGYADLWELSA